MQKSILTIGLIGLGWLVTSLPVLAQSVSGKTYNGYGYVYGGGFAQTYNGGGFTAGGGAEGQAYKGLSVGGELSWLKQTGQYGRDYGIASASIGYHFIKADSKFVPFITAGPSVVFRNGAVLGAHVGGGVNYWFKERVGARFEFRAQAPAHSDFSAFSTFRVGITFR